MKLFLSPRCASCEDLRRRVNLNAVPGLTVYVLDADPHSWAEADMLDVMSIPTLVLDDGSHVRGVVQILKRLTEAQDAEHG